MSPTPPPPPGFGPFVPGFDFLQKLTEGGAATVAGWVAPTLDPQALDKRIEELKAVQFWLDQNAAALKATLQALEVQKMTLAALRGMQPAAPGAQDKAAKPAGAGLPDPVQFWGVMTQQFQQIAAQAMQDMAARAATPAAGAAPAAAKKSAARRRKTSPGS